MNLQAAFYQQLDPARALTAEPADQRLYVDWQKELDLDDVKIRLARSIALSPGSAVCKLFTGHIGAGKTTELNRVGQILETGTAGRRLFVSFLQAQDWMDLQDAAPADVIFHMVRQLVEDLDRSGRGFGVTSFQQFFPELQDLFSREVELKSVKVPSSLAEFGMVLKDVPVARSTLRMLIQGRQPTIFQLINEVALVQARAWLRKQGYEDLLLIVDGLEKIPQKVINDRGLTNHENLFLDHQNVLRP